ncbi:hypothetical protein RUND412_003937 [Rhizina undulata]
MAPTSSRRQYIDAKFQPVKGVDPERRGIEEIEDSVYAEIVENGAVRDEEAR